MYVLIIKSKLACCQYIVISMWYLPYFDFLCHNYAYYSMMSIIIFGHSYDLQKHFFLWGRNAASTEDNSHKYKLIFFFLLVFGNIITFMYIHRWKQLHWLAFVFCFFVFLTGLKFPFPILFSDKYGGIPLGPPKWGHSTYHCNAALKLGWLTQFIKGKKKNPQIAPN